MKSLFCRKWILVVIAFPMLSSLPAWAQEIKSTTYRNHMGFGYGRGSTTCISTLSTPNGYNSTKEEYYCKTRDYVYTFGLNGLGSPDKSGLVFGFYLDGTIGLSLSDYYIRYSLGFDPVWSESFGVIMNLNAGIQMAYYVQESNIVFGMRYFNNYNADGKDCFSLAGQKYGEKNSRSVLYSVN